jgi:hypothetical protein
MNGLAEAACADLLSQKYKGQNVDGPTPEEDYPLARAKASALYLMFYTVKSELGFKQIYDLSRIPEEEMINGDKGLMPKGWVCTSFYTLAKMDIDSARGLISEVERYNTARKW